MKWEERNRGNKVGGRLSITNGTQRRPTNKQLQVQHHRKPFSPSPSSLIPLLTFLFLLSAPSRLVNGNLVRGRCVVLGEGWALVGLRGLGGASYGGIGRVRFGGRAAVHVLRGEQRHVCAKQILLDRTHCQASLQGVRNK